LFCILYPIYKAFFCFAELFLKNLE